MSTPDVPGDRDDADNAIEQMLEDELLDRRMKVMFLRNSGGTWSAIAKALDISTTTARKDWDRACTEQANQSPDQRRAVQTSVILDMRRANYSKMMRGDLDASNIILRGMIQEAKLYGLYPKIVTMPGISDTEFANEFVRLFESLRSVDPHALKELTSASEATSIIDAELIDAGPVPEPMGGAGPEAGRADAPGGAPPAAAQDQADPGQAAAVQPDGRPDGDPAAGQRDPGATGRDPGGLGASAGPNAHVDPDYDEDGWSNIE